MLFIFQTNLARKLLLKISAISRLTLDKHVLDIGCLEEVLTDMIDFPDNGELHEITTIDGLKVLVWNFDDYTACSSASKKDFSFVGNTRKIFEFDRPIAKGTISLPYFILEADESVVFHNNTQCVKETFTFPDVSEFRQMEAFCNSLRSHSYKVNRCDSVKTTNHYCEFSGGGDVYISKTNVSVPLVFVSSTVEESTEPAEESTESDEKSSVVDGNVHVSPLAHGDSRLASLIIEGGKGSCDSEKLKYQLWANMVVLAIANFMEAIKPSAKSFTKADLLKLEQLTGYGMACSGDGMVGAYKLEMKFGEYTAFVTKIQLGYRDRIQAAGLMDFILRYHKEWGGIITNQ